MEHRFTTRFDTDSSSEKKPNLRVADVVNGADKPKFSDKSLDQFYTLMRGLLEANPYRFVFHFQGMDATTVQMEWVRVGPTAGYIGWIWKGRIVAISFILGGVYPGLDELCITQGSSYEGMTLNPKATDAVRQTERPVLSTIYFDKKAFKQTPITVAAISLARRFVDVLQLREVVPPIGPKTDIAPERMITEIRISHDGVDRSELWYGESSFPELDDLIAALAEKLEAFPGGFDLQGHGALGFTLAWKPLSPITGVVTIERVSGERQMALYLGDTDKKNRDLAASALVDTFFEHLPEKKREEFARMIVTSPCPVVINLGVNYASGVDLPVTALAIAFFRRIQLN